MFSDNIMLTRSYIYKCYKNGARYSSKLHIFCPPHVRCQLKDMEGNNGNVNNEQLHKQLYDEGMAMRRKVLGSEWVDNSLAKGSSEFAKPMQELVTEYCWGHIWNRPGLELKTRSLLNLAMLTALGKSTELGGHVRGAINNGATEKEISETLLQASVYAGIPAGIEAFRVAEKVLSEIRNENKK